MDQLQSLVFMMGWRLIFIYSFSLILLTFLENSAYKFRRYIPAGPKPEFIKIRNEAVRNLVKNKDIAELMLAYGLGDLNRVSKEIKSAHQKTTIYHLFTPSGVHLTSLFVLFAPLFLYLKRMSRKWHFFTRLGIYMIPLCMSGLYAIKRVSLYKIVEIVLSRLGHKDGRFTAFLLAFLIDFCLGHFHQSPYSFAYSFLFFGIIIVSVDAHNGLLPLALLGGQIIIGYFQMTPQTHLGFLLGFILTSLFSLIFPLVWLALFFCYSKFILLAAWCVSCYWNLVAYSAQIAELSGTFFSTLPLLIIVLVIPANFSPRMKVHLVTILLCLHSEPVYNLPIDRVNGKKIASNVYFKIKINELQSMTHDESGMILKLKRPVECKTMLFNTHHSLTCRKKGKIRFSTEPAS